MDGMSLLDVLRGVMLDPAEQAAYNADPGAYLERYGYDDVDPADLSEAFSLVADTLPADQAQAAWEASTVADDGSFGAVTADFDADTTAADLPAPDGVAEGPSPADTGAAADVEPPLSFGEGGADTGDIDHPSFSDASTAGMTGLDDGGPEGGQGGGEGDGFDAVGRGELDDLDGDVDDGGLDDLDGDVDDGGLDDGLDDGDVDDLDDLDGGLDDGGLDDGGLDDGGLDDGGVDDLDDPGPDDLDIGSF